MRKTCPLVILAHAKRDLQLSDAENSSLADKIGGAPDLEPLRDFLASQAGRSSKGPASLRALGGAGWWTQSRLFDAGVDGITTDLCQACIAQDEDGPGRRLQKGAEAGVLSNPKASIRGNYNDTPS